jgi:isopenicillin N synthase-like dioxygenase
MIPTFDLSTLIDGGQGDGGDGPRRLFAAFEDHGGVCILTDGIEGQLIERCLAQAGRFHRLPVQEKMRWHVGSSNSIGTRGYIFGDASTNDPEPDGGARGLTEAASPGGLTYEAFILGFEIEEGDPCRTRAPCLIGPNVWPSRLPGFRDVVEPCHDALFDLGKRFSRFLATAIGAPTEWFCEHATKPCSEFRLLRYPPGSSGLGKRRLRAHTDFECFTILAQSAPGLQVLSSDGDWQDTPVWPDGIVVIAGNMLEFLTNGRLRSTLHRVVDTGQERCSLSYFFGLDYDTLLSPLPQYVDEDVSGTPVSAGEYRLRCVVEDMPHLRDRATHYGLNPSQAGSQNRLDGIARSRFEELSGRTTADAGQGQASVR